MGFRVSGFRVVLLFFDGCGVLGFRVWSATGFLAEFDLSLPPLQQQSYGKDIRGSECNTRPVCHQQVPINFPLQGQLSSVLCWLSGFTTVSDTLWVVPASLRPKPQALSKA